MGIVETIALTMGVAWASGINLYAAVAVLGILGATGNMILPQDLEVLSDPLVIGAACFMYFVEFFADKTPGVDSGWDAIHTFIRIPAGAVLAAAAVGQMDPAVVLAAWSGGRHPGGWYSRYQSRWTAHDQYLARAGDQLDGFTDRRCTRDRRFVDRALSSGRFPGCAGGDDRSDDLAVTKNLAGYSQSVHENSRFFRAQA